MRAFALLLLALAALAQTTFYPFAIDQDALSGAPDFSFLNHPLTAADRIFVRGSHFYRVGEDLEANTADDERVRFFGVNLAFGANFPEERDARRIARRLRRLGVNLVRLHHMDSQPDSRPENAGSLLTTGRYPTLNPVAVARLRAFLDALKAEGVWANLNLKVGYVFRPAVDGVPALPGGAAIPTQSKPLHMILPRMIELQADYTRAVIDALALNHDPVLAMVEINNESSLVQAWQSNQMDAAVRGDYETEFRRQWNAWLAARYPDTAALRAAWGGPEPDGPELLTANGWRTEIHAPAQAGMEPGETVKVTVTRGGAWVYLKQVGFTVTTDRPYLGQIEMRADISDGEKRSVNWDVKQDVSPWRTATNRSIEVTNQWQRFTLSFQPSFGMQAEGRFAVDVGAVAGTYYIRNWSFRQTSRRGLAAGESLEAGSVALVSSNETGTEARTNDFLVFLAARDRHYLDSIKAAVRDRAGPLVPVAGTQMGFGGLLNLESHAGLDYQDNHFYVDHYNFPNVSWDARDWRIRNDSSLGGGLTAFLNMAAAREAGRPYTVSEFNQPWPNTNGAEIDPTLAAFAAFQDWDGIVHFAYSHGRGWDDGVPNGFNINGDWTKFPNIGQAAWVFRTGAVRTAAESIEIPISRGLALKAAREKRGGSISAFLNAAAGYNTLDAVVHRVGIARDDSSSVPDVVRAPLTTPYESDTGELLYDRDKKQFIIRAPMAAGVFGQGPASAGAVEVETTGPVNLLATPLDGRPLAESGHVLISHASYSLRSQPGADPARPQRLMAYGGASDWWTLEPEPGYAQKPSGNLNGGSRPVWMARAEASVILRTQAAKIAVYPLDGDGGRMAPLAAERVEGGFRLRLHGPGQASSPWYEVVAEEAIPGPRGILDTPRNGAK